MFGRHTFRLPADMHAARHSQKCIGCRCYKHELSFMKGCSNAWAALHPGFRGRRNAVPLQSKTPAIVKPLIGRGMVMRPHNSASASAE